MEEQTISKAITLDEIRLALSEIEQARINTDISKEERELLELSSRAFRDAERLRIKTIQTSLSKEINKEFEDLKLLSKQIRERVSRMNKAAKVIDVLDDVFKELLELWAVIKLFV